IQLLSKQAKMRKESIELFIQGRRQDLVDKEQAQLNIISAYLPAQMSAEEADKIISKIVSDSGFTSLKDIGKVMGEAMKECKT
ncbi:MAG: GatB/YqeY domain-containing protein, partial [Burkholderiales bacterium]